MCLSRPPSLQSEVTLLRNEVAQLKQLLLAHKDCPVTLMQKKSGYHCEYRSSSEVSVAVQTRALYRLRTDLCAWNKLKSKLWHRVNPKAEIRTGFSSSLACDLPSDSSWFNYCLQSASKDDLTFAHVTVTVMDRTKKKKERKVKACRDAHFS